jgi:beta-carotene 15,15'-dioxygenase
MVKKWLHDVKMTSTFVSIVIGLVFVFMQHISGGLDYIVQISFFVFYLFVTGIPHGAIDHLVEKETAKRHKKPFKLYLFLLRYLLTMAFYGLVWYIIPSFSLLFFLFISAWHFGETDIEKAPSTIYWNVTRFIFGSFVLSWILLMHPIETTPILERISQNGYNVMQTWTFLTYFSTPFLVLLICFGSIFFAIAYKHQPILVDKSRLVRLFLILLLTYFMPLLPAFALYFGGWHALSAFKTIKDYLLDQKETSKNSLRPILKIWSNTLLFTSFVLLFSVFATWYWLHFLKSWDPLPLVFVFLSLITLPHLNVMHGMNKAIVGVKY